ncbi:endopeptidase La [Candidatus Dependentiae bacterium]|nr:MAG: endopeptidase La [Candidatus Dependentiae bacterium]
MIEKEKQQIQEKPIETIENPTILNQDQEDEFLALLPLKNVVILPKSILPIIVGRKQSIQAVEYALKQNKTLFITAQKDSKIEEPTEKDVFHYGTRSTILQVMRMPNGALKILAEGICRSEIIKIKHSDSGFIGVMCKDILATDLDDNNVELEATWRQLKELYTLYTKLNEKVPADLVTLAKTRQEMDYIVDTIAVHIHLSFEERQTILETASLKNRMLKLCKYLTQEIEILKTEQRIKGRIQQQVEKSQREYYLTEQIKAIQKELGREDQATELNEIQEKIIKLKLSPEAREKVEKEMRRLEQMPPLSSEAVVSRNYVDWITSLPWNNITKDTISINQAEKVLNRDHAGLHKVKERIIEFLAAKKFSKKIERSPIICLVGPPGVGKTSLARSIADSLGRAFARISLGGIRDEAEIRGHRRTYIGALPGKIIHAIKKAGTMNPVILLDEIDKISKDIHGDPSAALLEVLDPEQNRRFVDHFLDIDFDLSNVMFLTTANTVDGIPFPLFDRMEIIPLSGYTEQEKIEIARNFLIPKALKEYDLNARQFKLPEQQLHTIITKYTQEAGVRQLERIITKLMRKAIQMLLKDKTLKSVTVSEKRLRSWLGTQKFKRTQLKEIKNRIGLAVGLAWTEFGGDILEIEATAVPGKGTLTLTGQLGDVMQESAQAALSYIRSQAQELGLKNSFNSINDIHVHIPEGATPKDGPSAGITICTSMISALTKIPTQPQLTMTGEITLQGRILPVGGLKEKLLAAKQHNIQTIILPKENYDDIQEILKETDLGLLQFIFVNTMDEVLEKAFIKKPLRISKKTARKRKK